MRGSKQWARNTIL